MRIAYIVSGFPILSETFILNQITGLIDRGHTVDIFPLNYQNQGKYHPDIEKYSLLERCYYRSPPKNKWKRVTKVINTLITNKQRTDIFKTLNIKKFGREALSLNLFFNALPFIVKEPYDVVHCHFGPNGLIGAKLKSLGLLKGPLITTFHGYDITTYLNENGSNIYNPLFNYGDIFLPISNKWSEKLIDLGCQEDKIRVHRMGVNINDFDNIDKKTSLDKVKIVTIARLVEKKGVYYGIKAVSKLIKERKNIEYLIIGDGPLRNMLEKLIKDEGCDSNISLLGWKDQAEIISNLANADILLQPSVTSEDGDQEGIPVVMMEAMAMQIPIVSTLHSGIPELVSDTVSGFLVPEKDSVSLETKLKLLVDDIDLRKEMGSQGRRKIEKEYNIEVLNDNLINIFSKNS